MLSSSCASERVRRSSQCGGSRDCQSPLQWRRALPCLVSCRNKAFASGCCCLHGTQHMLKCSSWADCGAAGCDAHAIWPSDRYACFWLDDPVLTCFECGIDVMFCAETFSGRGRPPAPPFRLRLAFFLLFLVASFPPSAYFFRNNPAGSTSFLPTGLPSSCMGSNTCSSPEIFIGL